MGKIVLDKVCKQFPDGSQVLHDASFTIHDGELFILIGPSGCGKSTLLNMIVGLEDISSGEIRVDDRLVNDLDPKDRNMAMVFQSYAIYPHMTVRENIAFPLRMAGLSKVDISRKVEAAAAMLELGELLERKPANLSGGQRQRVAMGRALVRNPAAFLLDEPLSNLDARLRLQMRTEISRLQKKLGTTMIYVTHDQTEAMTLGDRIAVLNQGEVQQIGTPQQLYQTPANLFVAGFIGSPAMNFVPVEVKDNQLVLPFGELNLPEYLNSLPNGQHIAGFRPESIKYDSTINSNPQELVFQAYIDLAEWLGSELFVYADIKLAAAAKTSTLPLFDSGSVTLVARLPPSASVKQGDSVSFKLAIQDIHLFDGKTGRNPAA